MADKFNWKARGSVVSRTRQGHHSKSIGERKRYWDTVIRAPGPTMEDSAPIIDTTDRSATTEERRIPPFKPTKQPSAIKLFLKENLIEIIGTIIVSLLLWGAYQLYAFNREVGELRSTLNNVRDSQSKLDSQVDKMEKRIENQIGTLSSDIDRMEQRVDDVVDRQLRVEPRTNTRGQK